MWAAKGLAKADVDVVVIDRNNYHSFFPLLYQVAAGELEPAYITYPVRSILRKQKNASFRLGDVSSIRLEDKTVVLTDGELSYDYLVLAPGSTTRYFGVPGASEHTHGLRSLDEGIILRNHLLRAFETAASTSDVETQRKMLTFVVIGGGSTGVEFSGALREFLNGSYSKDFGSDGPDPRVILVEGSDTLIGMYPPRLRNYAVKRLRRLGVEVRLGTRVASVSAGLVETDAETTDCGTVVWTAGVGGRTVYGDWGLPGGPGETVQVTPSLNIESHREVFVVGDVAHNAASPTPMVAQNALQQGRHAAVCISNLVADRPLTDFEYKDFGNMAVIGRNAAVVHLWNKIELTGFIAWVIWLIIHLVKLIGFRNRLAAIISWTSDYFFGNRVARLIIPSGRPPLKH